jgi:hypothetical protein
MARIPSGPIGTDAESATYVPALDRAVGGLIHLFSGDPVPQPEGEIFDTVRKNSQDLS